jgi:oligopeptide transport system permease protein
MLGPVIVYATLTIPTVMLQEAFLSFLGLGVQPPLPSWGVLAAEGAQSMVIWPWLLVFAIAALSLTLFSLNVIGDGLRDALDPQASY